MKITWAPLLLLALLPACNRTDTAASMQPLSGSETEEAHRAVADALPDYRQVLFICGQSDGLGLFVDDFEKGFQPDGMKDGRLVFLTRSDGHPDLLFRDATGAFKSAVDDGADVHRITTDQGGESWLIAYAITGVTETHNITTLSDGRLIDLWTSNKPTTIVPANAKLFRTECKRA